MSVRDNLELGGYLRSARERRAAIAEALRLFPRLAERLGQAAGTMSGGEQQMLAVARGLVSRPRLLMLDEPSLGLAPKMVGELLRILQRIRDEGTSVLLVEQSVRQALAIADHGYVMERGAIVRRAQAPNCSREMSCGARIWEVSSRAFVTTAGTRSPDPLNPNLGVLGALAVSYPAQTASINSQLSFLAGRVPHLVTSSTFSASTCP